MNRSLQFAAALLLGAFPVWSQATKEPSKQTAKPAPKVVVPAIKPGVKGGGTLPKNAPRPIPQIPHPPNPQIVRFLRMPQKEREIYIDKMPVPQQERLRNAAARFDAQPQEERDRQLKLFESLNKLPKEKQDLVFQRLGEMNQLGNERKVAIRRAYQLLSEKPDDQQRAMLDSPEFKERFTPMEQQIVVDLVKYYPNPKM